MTCVKCGHPLVAGSAFCGRCGASVSPSTDTRASAPIGEVLDGKWKLEQKIGEGGMGTVYLAQDLQLERKVAIKLLAASLVNDAELIERFEREARLTARLEHPNIVPLYAVGRAGDRPFMVMKYLEGAPLSSHLRKQGGIGRDELLPLMRQVAAGLDFIHARGFIHRDVKTSNIFVGPHGEATILDFGIVRPSRDAKALTRTGMVMGTPQYLAPEQALGVRDIDHRADLYAFATVVFECLTGTLPFEADNELKIIQLQAHAPPPDVRERAPWVPQAVSAVMQRGLAKRPEDRFPTALALCAALEHAFGVVLFTGPGGVPLLSTLPREAAQPVDALDAGKPPVPYPIPLGAIPEAEVRQRTGGSWPATPALDQGPLDPATPSAVSDARTVASRRTVRSRRAAVFGAALLLVTGVALVALRTRTADAPRLDEEAAKANGVAASASPVKLAPGTPAGDVVPARAVEQTPADTAAPTAPREVAAPAPGKVHVLTTYRGDRYWASLKVDGEKRGTTPAVLELPAGAHLLRIERTGFKTIEKQIKVAPGGSAVVRIELVP